MTIISDSYDITHSGSVSWRRVNDVTGTEFSLGDHNPSYTFTYGSSRDVVPNPNYRSRIGEGEIVIGPYSSNGSRELSYSLVSGEVTKYGGYQSTDIGYYTSCPIIDKTSVISSLGSYTVDVSDNEVIAATAAQAAMLEGAAQTLVSIVESGKTLSLLAKSANRIIRVLQSARRSIRRGKGVEEIRSFYRDLTLDDAMNAWMEYRYGWRPLLYDITSHQEALSNILTDQGRYWKKKSSSDVSSPVSVSGVLLGSFWDAGGGISCTGTVTAYPKRVGALAGYFYKVFPEYLNSELYWLGFQSPTSVVWELVPYSFVIDWFANIGDYLTSISSFPAYIRDPRGFLSTSQTWVITAQGDSFSTSYTPYVNNLNLPRASFETWSFVRKNINPGDYVGLRTNVNLNTFKLIDLFALARNLAGSNKADVAKRINRI